MSSTEAIQPIAAQLPAVSYVPDVTVISEAAATVPILSEPTTSTSFVHKMDEQDDVTLFEDPLDSVDAFDFVTEVSDAEPSSVFAALAEMDLPQDPETAARERQITEAFQADLNITTLLEIIRGADMATITRLVGDPEAKANVAAGTELPV